MRTAFPSADLVRINADTVIHRYMRVEELIGLLGGTLRMTCPFKWAAGKDGDRWENLLFQTKVIGRDGIPLNTGGAGCKIYVQSWTMTEESDAMWRLYGDGKSVKITSTAGALLQLVQGGFDLEKNEWVTFKIGAVKYLDSVEVQEKFASPSRFRGGLRDPHAATLLKRLAFKHEHEVRLVAWDFDDRNRRPELDTVNLVRYPANPFHFDIALREKRSAKWINEVVISPRLNRADAAAVVEEIKSHGFSRKRIRESMLYGRLRVTVDLR